MIVDVILPCLNEASAWPRVRMGAALLLHAAADAGLHVAAQWRHGDRTFVSATTRAAPAI